MEITIPKTSAVMTALLRADFTTLWRNRRSVVMVLLVPMIIVFAWKDFMPGPFILSNSITLGLVAIGLMGYTNSIARDRDKGVFQRLRVSPLPLWTIMASRLLVQLTLIIVLTIVVFVAGYEFDHITISATNYLFTFIAAVVGGAVYLSLGQIIVGRIKNPETVNSTARLVYFAFIIVGMFGESGLIKEEIFRKFADWSPYGTVNHILAGSIDTAKWTGDTTQYLLLTLGYTIVFAVLGIKWFKWDSK